MMNDTIILVTEETVTDATKQKYKREVQTDEFAVRTSEHHTHGVEHGTASRV